MHMINQIPSYFRLLSLDVVLGACVSTLFVAKYLKVDLPLMVAVALGVAVWIIYTFDHLLDGQKTQGLPLTLRHQFHQRNSKKLYIAVIFMSIFGLGVIIQLPWQVINSGLWLVLVIIVYFFGLKLIGSRPSFYKEPLVALAYAIGVFLGPMSVMETIEVTVVLPLFLIYALLALVNLLVFSVYEVEIDEQDEHTSLVRLLGVRMVNHIIWTCFIGILGLLTYKLLSRFDLILIVIALMALALLLIHSFKVFFKRNEWYRIVGDAVFYFPVIALI